MRSAAFFRGPVQDSPRLVGGQRWLGTAGLASATAPRNVGRAKEAGAGGLASGALIIEFVGLYIATQHHIGNTHGHEGG